MKLNKAENLVKRMKEKGNNRIDTVMELFDGKFRSGKKLPPEYINALNKYYPKKHNDYND